MKRFWQNKFKIFFLCGFVLLGLTGCSNPRGQDGKTLLDQVISSERIEIQVNQVNIKDIKDKDLKKKYSKLDENDTIVIEPTTFKETIAHSWFDGLIVWPIAQLINVFASVTDAVNGKTHSISVRQAGLPSQHSDTELSNLKIRLKRTTR